MMESYSPWRQFVSLGVKVLESCKEEDRHSQEEEQRLCKGSDHVEIRRARNRRSWSALHSVVSPERGGARSQGDWAAHS